MNVKTLSELCKDTGTILDEMDDALDEDGTRWPHSIIHEGMLVQPSPGHREFHRRADQSGLVTAQHNELFEVLWNDNSLEKVTAYSLEPLHDREVLNKHLQRYGYGLVETQLRGDWDQLDKNTGDTQGTLTSQDPPARFRIGDIVSVGFGLSAFHDYQGAGIVVDVDHSVVPPEYFIHWPHANCWLPEDELEPYDV